MLKKILFAILITLPAVCLSEEASRGLSQSLSRFDLLVKNGQLVPANEIRVDEWINYQKYDFPALPETVPPTRAGLFGAVRVHGAGGNAAAMMMLATRTAPQTSERLQPVDLVIVLDRSGSMEGQNIRFAHTAIRKLTSVLRTGDRLGLIGFDSQLDIARTLAPFNTGDSIDAELATLTARAGTDLNLGLTAGMQMLENAAPAGDPVNTPARARRMMVITDARTNQGDTNTDKIIANLQSGFDKGIRLSCIGVGVNYNDALLSRLARIPGNNGRFLDKAEEIEKSMVQLCDCLLPLEVDKPNLTVVLPAGVRVSKSYGTEVVQLGNALTFPNLTSLGSDDYEIVCLQLRGEMEVLQKVAGSPIELSAYSSLEKSQLRLRSFVQNVTPGAIGLIRNPTIEFLQDALQKAGAVAQAADALRNAAEKAERKDWTGVEAALRSAESSLVAFRTSSDAEITRIKELVDLDRKVLESLKANPK